MFIIGRGRKASQIYPQVSRGSSGTTYQWGADTIREQVEFAATDDTETGAAMPPLLRDVAGNPLQITFPTWTSGDVLRVRWAASAFATLAAGSSGWLAPRVSVDGADFKVLDNGSQIGLVGVPGVLVYAFGEAPVAISGEGPIVVQLGLGLYSPTPGDKLTLPGGAMSLTPGSLGVPNIASTWLFAERFSAGTVTTLPPVQLSDLPIPPF